MGENIGTALFISIGSGLARVGPGSLFLAYAIYASFLALVNNGTAETTVLFPVSGGSVRLAGHFVDEAFGSMAGWKFFLYVALIFPFEITALTMILGFWSDGIPPWSIPIAGIVLYGLINCLAIKAYSEAEFWLLGGKVVLIFLLFAFTFVTVVGGKFEGLLACLWSAPFCIVGPEYLSMVSAEAKRPRGYIKNAFKTVYVRFAIFFVGGSLAAGIVVAYCDPTLVGIVSRDVSGGGTASASPYVIAMNNLHIHDLQHLVNALLVTSIFSAGNTYTYCDTRSLYGMALDGRALKFLRYCTKNGVPLYCFAIIMILSCLSFLQVSNGSAKVLNWLINLVTAGGVINYISMTVTYIFFYRACKAQGLDRKTLPNCGWFQPYSAWIGLAWMVMIVTCYGYSIYAPWSTENWFIYYAMLILALVLFVFWKVLHRTSFVKPLETDLTWELPTLDAYEATFVGPPTSF